MNSGFVERSRQIEAALNFTVPSLVRSISLISAHRQFELQPESNPACRSMIRKLPAFRTLPRSTSSRPQHELREGRRNLSDRLLTMWIPPFEGPVRHPFGRIDRIRQCPNRRIRQKGQGRQNISKFAHGRSFELRMDRNTDSLRRSCPESRPTAAHPALS